MAAEVSFTFVRTLADGAAYAPIVKTACASSGWIMRNGAGALATVALHCAHLEGLGAGPIPAHSQ